MAARTLDEGGRLDKILAGWSDVGSRRRAREAIETCKVFVDGAVCTEAGRTVQAGASVEIQWNRPGTAKDRVKGERELHAAREGEPFVDAEGSLTRAVHPAAGDESAEDDERRDQDEAPDHAQELGSTHDVRGLTHRRPRFR